MKMHIPHFHGLRPWLAVSSFYVKPGVEGSSARLLLHWPGAFQQHELLRCSGVFMIPPYEEGVYFSQAFTHCDVGSSAVAKAPMLPGMMPPLAWETRTMDPQCTDRKTGTTSLTGLTPEHRHRPIPATLSSFRPKKLASAIFDADPCQLLFWVNLSYHNPETRLIILYPF